MLSIIAKLLRVLNSETNPAQISLAFCLAMLAGLTPFSSLHNLMPLFLVLILRVNLSSFLVGLAFFSGVAYLLDPVFHQIGLGVLKAEALQNLWTQCYNNPFIRLTRFNNTILMGSLVFSLLFFIPLFMATNLFIRKYRDHILTLVQKSRIMKALKASKFYSIYNRVDQIRGKG